MSLLFIHHTPKYEAEQTVSLDWNQPRQDLGIVKKYAVQEGLDVCG